MKIFNENDKVLFLGQTECEYVGFEESDPDKNTGKTAGLHIMRCKNGMIIIANDDEIELDTRHMNELQGQ